MILKFSVPAKQIKETTMYDYKFSENTSFPIACIGRDSYVVDSTITNGLDYSIPYGKAIYNLQIGQFTSIAHGISFCMGVNHDYLRLCTGVSDLFETNKNENNKNFSEYKHKGQILIQNDVWVGHNVTIMPGVTIHNGAVIAANSHVVKDVPPYAIVGGNPAKIIKYRFSEDIIDKLITIQWWNWSNEKIIENGEFFKNISVEKFCEKFYEQALESDKKSKKFEIEKSNNTYLFFPDFSENYPIWEKVIREFITKFKEEEDSLLLLYISEDYANDNKELIDVFTDFINKILLSANAKCKITLCIDKKENEESIFRYTDYFITNRSKDTIAHSCYCDKNKLTIISGVDEPIF